MTSKTATARKQWGSLYGESDELKQQRMTDRFARKADHAIAGGREVLCAFIADNRTLLEDSPAVLSLVRSAKRQLKKADHRQRAV